MSAREDAARAERERVKSTGRTREQAVAEAAALQERVQSEPEAPAE